MYMYLVGMQLSKQYESDGHSKDRGVLDYKMKSAEQGK